MSRLDFMASIWNAAADGFDEEINESHLNENAVAFRGTRKIGGVNGEKREGCCCCFGGCLYGVRLILLPKPSHRIRPTNI